MEADQARLAWVRARDEENIMQESIKRGHQVIGDLLCSNGDHSDDIKILRGLIEGWMMLAAAHDEEMAMLEQSQKNHPGEEVA